MIEAEMYESFTYFCFITKYKKDVKSDALY